MKKDLVLDERELKEIHHAIYYYRYLHHGTVGHNLLMLLGKIADSIGFDVDPDGDLIFDGDTQTTELIIK